MEGERHGLTRDYYLAEASVLQIRVHSSKGEEERGEGG